MHQFFLLQVHCLKKDLGDDPTVNGNKQLEDVMTEMKQCKADLKMEVQNSAMKRATFDQKYEQVEILQLFDRKFQLYFDPLKFI